MLMQFSLSFKIHVCSEWSQWVSRKMVSKHAGLLFPKSSQRAFQRDVLTLGVTCWQTRCMLSPEQVPSWCRASLSAPSWSPVPLWGSGWQADPGSEAEAPWSAGSGLSGQSSPVVSLSSTEAGTAPAPSAGTGRAPCWPRTRAPRRG